MHYVYLRELPGGQIYVGLTNDLERREYEHRKGKGSHTTCMHGPGRLLYVEKHSDRNEAVARERQLKGWRRAKKLALAAGDLDLLKVL